MVIIEYGLNDIIYPGELEAAKRARKNGVNGGSVGGPYGDAADLLLTSERLAFERVLRVVLGLPSRPAVLLLEAFSYTHSKATLGGFATLPQDTHAVLAAYYGQVQVLSARSVIHPIIYSTASTTSSTSSTASSSTGGEGSTAWVNVPLLDEDVMKLGLFQEDLTHPSDAGVNGLQCGCERFPTRDYEA
jgi:hypothetical protein